MKKTLSIFGAVLFVLGFCMATGVDKNPWQSVYSVGCIAAAAWLSYRAETISTDKSASEELKVKSEKLASYQDAA